MSWNATCHCGAVSIHLARAPEELAECNCSLCFSHGILWAYYSPRDVVIEGETRTYHRADRPNPNSDLHFCPACGCSTHWSATEGLIERMGGEVDLMGVNMRLFAPSQLSGLKLSFPDGRHWSGEGSWDDARASPGSCPDPMTPDAIIFDFDGVIADSEVRANQTLAESLTAIGLPTSYDDCLRDYYGHNWQETQRRIEARFGRALPADFRDRHRERARARFAEGFGPVPGAPEFLASLGDRPRAVASSSSPAYIAMSLDRFGLAHHFGRHVYSADGWDRGKPHPDIYLAAAKGLEVDPAACLAIEDSPTGAQAALAAGMTVVGFCGAGHIADRAAHGAVLRAVGVHGIAFEFSEITILS